MRPGTQALAALITVTLSVTACSETPPDPNEVSLANARDCLTLADYQCALDNFTDIDATTDRWTVERQTGIALSRLGIWLSVVGREVIELAETLAAVGTNAPGLAVLQDNLAGESYLNRLLYRRLQPIWDDLNAVLGSFDEALAAGDDFEVNILALPIRLGGVPVVEFSGRLKRHDLLLFKTWLHGAASALALVLAADFEFPVAQTILYGAALETCRDIADSAQSRRCIYAMTAFAINNSDTILTREPNRGPAFQKDAREQLASFFDSNRLFFDALEAESQTTNDTSRRIFQYLDRPGEKAWIVARFSELPLGTTDIASILAGDLEIDPPYSGSVSREVRFVLDERVRNAADDIISHLRDRAPEFVKVEDAVVPAVETASEAILQSDVLISTLQVVISSLDPEFAQVFVDLLEQLKGLYTDLDTADAVHNLFEFLVPNSLEIDYHALLDTPEYLRQLMPEAATANVDQDGTSLTEWKWLVEWECDELLADLIGCPTDAALVDEPHFTGTPFTMPADGAASRIGYVAFADPSFNKMLRLNLNEVDATYPVGITHIPDLETLNVLIQEAGREFLRRIDQ